MHAADLIDLGLTEDEAKVYLALLELGGSYVSAVARKSGVHRVNCYKILDTLVGKGLVNQFTKDNVKHFAVENPKVLIRKQQKLLEHAEHIVPELLSITNSLAYKPRIQYYEGREGLINICEDMLRTEDEILGYTNFADLPRVLPENYLTEFANQKIRKHIKTRMLSPHSIEGLQHLGRCYPQGFDTYLVEVMFVNPKDFPFEYQVTIYEDKVAILSLNPDELLGMIIQSPVYARTERSIFRLAWLGAEPFVAPVKRKERNS